MQEHHLKKISLICTIIGLTALFAITYFLEPPITQSNFKDNKQITSTGKVLRQTDVNTTTFLTTNICEEKNIILFKNNRDFRNSYIEIKGTTEDDQIIADEVRKV